MAPHSSVLAWRIPGMGKPGGLPSLGSHRVGHDWNDLAAAAVLSHILLVRHQSKLVQSSGYTLYPFTDFCLHHCHSGLSPLFLMKAVVIVSLQYFTHYQLSLQPPGKLKQYKSDHITSATTQI